MTAATLHEQLFQKQCRKITSIFRVTMLKARNVIKLDIKQSIQQFADPKTVICKKFIKYRSLQWHQKDSGSRLTPLLQGSIYDVYNIKVKRPP